MLRPSRCFGGLLGAQVSGDPDLLGRLSWALDVGSKMEKIT